MDSQPSIFANATDDTSEKSFMFPKDIWDFTSLVCSATCGICQYVYDRRKTKMYDTTVVDTKSGAKWRMEICPDCRKKLKESSNDNESIQTASC